MKFALGIIGITIGALLGLYVGVWVFFVGGIIGLIQALVALISGKILVSLIGWSIVKIILAGIAGWLSASVLIIPSVSLLK